MSTKNDTTKREEGPRSFALTLQKLDDGEAEIRLSEELHELLQKLAETAYERRDTAVGAMTLALKFEVEPNGSVEIAYQTSVKLPSKRSGKAVMFLTPGANLTPENPKQQKLAFRDVKAEPETREPGEERAAVRDI